MAASFCSLCQADVVDDRITPWQCSQDVHRSCMALWWASCNVPRWPVCPSCRSEHAGVCQLSPVQLLRARADRISDSRLVEPIATPYEPADVILLCCLRVLCITDDVDPLFVESADRKMRCFSSISTSGRTDGWMCYRCDRTVVAGQNDFLPLPPHLHNLRHDCAEHGLASVCLDF